MSVPAIYGKMFGAGLFLGAGLEVLLIKGNYCMYFFTFIKKK